MDTGLPLRVVGVGSMEFVDESLELSIKDDDVSVTAIVVGLGAPDNVERNNEEVGMKDSLLEADGGATMIVGAVPTSETTAGTLCGG